MSVKISTKEKLDSNAYTGIVIREDNEQFFVKVNGNKCDCQYEGVSYLLTNRLKGLSDFQKIVEIVDSFLENTTIDRIETDVYHVGYSGKFIVVGGSRCLCLQIENYELLRHIVNMIKNKYDRDRYKYLDNTSSSLYSVCLNQKKSSYGMEFISCEDCDYDCNLGYCPKVVTCNLMYSNGKILGFDKKFIERFIYDKLWECGEKATIYEERKDIKLVDGITVVGNYVNAYYIMCGNLEIKFPCSVFTKEAVCKFCNDIINKYNSELEELSKCKKRQLKMEGF